MAYADLNSATATTLNSSVSDFSVSSQVLDSASNDETYYDIKDAPQKLGYYKTIPELKKAIDSLVMWSVGKGWETELTEDEITLDHLTGFGKDNFQTIMENLLICKKVYGDAFAEIIRNENSILINLKPLDPAKVRIITDKKGIIKRYEFRQSDGKIEKFKPNEILHLCNDRIGDEIHGVSVIDACKWVIDARNEAMSDWRRVLHRSTIRVLIVDEDNATRLTQLKNQYAEAINKGEVLVLPGKSGDTTFQELTAPPIQAFMEWIRYLEGFFMKAVGVPEVILGGSQSYTEASSKVGFLTFEVPYSREQMLLEEDLWDQLAIRVKFNRPPSLMRSMQESESANTGQVGFQPTELQPGRNE